jgi:murein DD-endopeptidase MepM/ murein hydrolase activator NlpD
LTDQRIAKASKRLRAAEKKLGRRADAIYRSGGQTSLIMFVLGAASFDEFITRADLMTRIGDTDAALVNQVKDTRRTLKASRVTMVAEVAKEKKQLTVFKARRDKLQAQFNAVQSRYSRLLAELAAQLEREKQAGHITYSPKGPNGMVFPVRGVHYYANTWGAPRSGGRRHMGTDIMSPTGTPCVAVLSGNVNAHYNSLGGNSITLTADSGWVFYYAHLNSYVVRSGHVSAGQLIGTVGSTGNARGGAPHLHFQMGPGARWTNPYPYLRQME